MLHFEYTLEPAELVEFKVWRAVHEVQQAQPQFQRLEEALLTIFLLAGLALSGGIWLLLDYSGRASLFFGFGYSVFWIIIGSILTGLVTSDSVARRARKRFTQRYRDDAPVRYTVTITQHDCASTSAQQRLRFNWTNLKHCAVHEEAIYLIMSTGCWLIIPQRACSPEQWADIVELGEAHMPLFVPAAFKPE